MRGEGIKTKEDMPMKTPQEYIESLRKLNLVVYMFGKRVENVVDDPIIRPSHERRGHDLRAGA